jgi:hypothetical protein
MPTSDETNRLLFNPSQADLTAECLQLTAAVGTLAAACHPGGDHFTDSDSRAAIFDALLALEFLIQYIERRTNYSMAEAFQTWSSDQDVDLPDELPALPRIAALIAEFHSLLVKVS